MANYFVNLPAARAPSNAMLNFQPLAQAVAGIRERNRQSEVDSQNAMLAQNREARAAETHQMRKQEFSQGQRDRTMQKLLGVVQMVDQDQDENSRAAKWQKLIQAQPAIGKTLEEYGVSADDYVQGPRAIISSQTGYQQPTQPEWKKIGQDAYGNDQYGWVDPSTQSVSGVQGGGAPVSAGGQKEMPDVPPGVDPKTYLQQRAKEVAKRDVKAPEKQRAAHNKTQELVSQGQIAVQEIDKAIKNADDPSWMPGTARTGASGYVNSFMPGSAAYNLGRTLDTIKAQVGFDKLQAMREASPTGGALGQVSERENELLQSVLGSLDQFQDAETLKGNLQRIKEILLTRAQRYQQAYQSDYGGSVDVEPIETTTGNKLQNRVSDDYAGWGGRQLD